MKSIGIWRMNGCIGGLEVSLIELARFLKTCQQDVTLYGKAGPLASMCERYDVAVAPDYEILEHEHDILIWADNFGVFAETRSLCDPCAITNHMQKIDRKIACMGGWAGWRNLMPWCDEVIVKSQHMEQWAKSISGKPVFARQFPIDLQIWKRKPDRVQNDPLVVGYVGRTEDKGIDDARRIAREAGCGEIRTVCNCIKWSRDAFDEIDIFIMCSKREGGIPRSIMEAMALSLPVVCYASGGITELNPSVWLPETNRADAVAILRTFAQAQQNRLDVGNENRQKIERFDTRSRFEYMRHLDAWPSAIDLGCGKRPKPDHFGIDCRGDMAADLVWDLEQGIPWPNNTVEYVYSSHFLEHVADPEALLREIQRVCVKGAVVEMKFPLEMPDPAHKVIFHHDVWRSCFDAFEIRHWAVVPVTTTAIREDIKGQQFTYDEARITCVVV